MLCVRTLVDHVDPPVNDFWRCGIRVWLIAVFTTLLCSLSLRVHAQTAGSAAPVSSAEVRELRLLIEELQARDARLESEIQALKTQVRAQESSDFLAQGEARIGPHPPTDPEPQSAVSNSVAATPGAFSDVERGAFDFLKGNTINFAFDGYYTYNFNHPYGRVNLLRAYDVLSNVFSLNQASVILEHAPDVAAGKRFGMRLDLQFGQATETLQGNPANEPRPQIYRNVFQAYGTYVLPIGRGLTVDFGKWASSLGFENNYTKDQMNYSRSYWFNFLPFYHMGVRASYPFNDKIALNYWVINGTDQTEPTNAFKDQLFGIVLTPRKTVSWTANYYLGQEHPDVQQVPNTGSIPIQQGLSFAPIRPAPDGRLHIVDSYISWQARLKWTVGLEGDYVIERQWRHAGPGRSSAPSEVWGGAGYVRYQASPRFALAARVEYLSDAQGLFSGVNQALKETTATFDYKIADGFLMRYEWRRDFSNQPFFQTDTFASRSRRQNTATVGLLWWFGQKQGAW